MKFTIEKIYSYFVYSLFLLPLICFTGIWNPFESPRVFFFLFVIELILPVYLYLIVKYPEHRPSLKDPVLILLVTFLLLETIAGIFGKDVWNSFLGNAERMDGILVWYHLFFFYLYLNFSIRFNPHTRKNFLKLFLIIAGITASIGCLQNIGIVPFFSTEFAGRSTSTLGNPIFLASVLIIPFFLSLAMQQNEPNKFWKYLYRTITAICFLSILGTQTRGAFVGLVAGGVAGICFWFWKTRAHINKKRFLFIAITSIVILLASFFGIRTFSPADDSLSRLTHFSGANTDSRLLYWNYAIKGWKQSPWVGVGAQNFSFVADNYFQSSAYALEQAWPDKPHNVVLEMLVTGGIFTCLVYLLLFVFAVWTLIKDDHSESLFWKSILLAALVAYFVQNLFVFDTMSSLLSIFFLFALIFVQEKSVSRAKLSDVHPLIWCSFIIPLFGFMLLSPIVQELYLVHVAVDEANIDRHTALITLEKIKQLPYIFDEKLIAKTETDILNNELVSDSKQQSVSDQAYTDAKETIGNAIAREPLRAENYYLAAFVEYLHAVGSHTHVSDQAIELAKKGIALAPGRVEALVSLANIYQANDETQLAFDTASQAVQMAPTEPRALWTLATLYAKLNKLDLAAPLGLKSVQNGLSIADSKELGWLINYYVKQHDAPTIVFLYEYSVSLEPTNLTLLPQLAAAYANNGQKEKAIETANLLKQKDPTSAPGVDAFIQSLR